MHRGLDRREGPDQEPMLLRSSFLGRVPFSAPFTQGDGSEGPRWTGGREGDWKLQHSRRLVTGEFNRSQLKNKEHQFLRKDFVHGRSFPVPLLTYLRFTPVSAVVP